MNEEKLIQYLFNLCSESERQRIEQHLAASAEDRARLEQLKTKLAQLDLIKEDVQAPEQLITDTLRRTRLTERPARATAWPRWLWLTTSAAAAALLFVILVPMPRPQIEPSKSQVAATPAPQVTKGYEVTLAKTPEPLDELQPLPERKDSDNQDVSALGAPPAEEPVVELAQLEEQKVPELEKQVPAATLAMAKMDAQSRVAGDGKEMGTFGGSYAIVASAPRREVADFAGQRKLKMSVAARSYGADGLVAVDLDASKLRDAWTAGPNGCVSLRAAKTNDTAEISVSSGCKDIGVVIRWNTIPKVHVAPGATTNFVVQLEEGTSP